MAYNANSELFCKSNTTAWPTPIVVQTDPLISIGGWAPVGFVSGSGLYRGATTDAPHVTGPNIISDNQLDGIDGGSGQPDPAIGDYYWVMEGGNAGTYGKILDLDYVSSPGTITIDKVLPDLTSVAQTYRTFPRDNVFDSVNAAAGVDGYVDYRQIWFIHDNGPNEGGARFHVDPIKANGCDIEICVATPTTTNGTSSQAGVYLPADRFEDPFQETGIIKDITSPLDTAARYDKHDKRRKFYSPDSPTPLRGLNSHTDNDQWSPMWLKRTIRPGGRGGECAFRVVLTNPDATTPNPDPYESGFIMSWFIDPPTYTATIEQDRIAYTDRSSRLKATITDDRGVPVPNLSAYLELESGPGSVTADKSLRTNSAGEITALYNSPSALGADPVVRVVIPTATET